MPKENDSESEGKLTRAPKSRLGRRPSEVSFPRDTLKRSLKVAESIEKNNAGKPYNRLDLAQSVSLSPSSYSFRSLLRSSIRHGLTEGSEKADRIQLTALGTSIVSPAEEGEVARGLRTALLKPPLFKKILDYYDKKRIPPEELFKNALKREFGVPVEDVDVCFQILMQNLKDYGLIQKIKDNDYLQLDRLSSATSEGEEGVPTEESEEERAEVQVRTEEEVSPPAPTQKPRDIFVAHGRNKKPLEQLKTILAQFKVPFKVAIDEPHKGRAISAKVSELMRACGSGIFIFTADEEATDANGNRLLRPSDNVVFELGAGTVLYGDKIVILREEGVSFGSDFTDYGHITFEKDRLDAKALDLIRELIGLGFLQVTPT